MTSNTSERLQQIQEEHDKVYETVDEGLMEEVLPSPGFSEKIWSKVDGRESAYIKKHNKVTAEMTPMLLESTRLRSFINLSLSARYTGSYLLLNAK